MGDQAGKEGREQSLQGGLCMARRAAGNDVVEAVGTYLLDF